MSKKSQTENSRHDTQATDTQATDTQSTVIQAAEIERLANEPQGSLPREFYLFVRANKQWWLLPIVAVLLLLGVLVLLGSTGAAPFIYTLY
ncbi:MAG: DUF5989 family protein [Pirellulales bacterium]